MSYRKINIGAGEGTGDGDSIRLAFEKSNSNFEGADNRLQVLETGVVRADGTVTGNIVPDTDVTYDLGSSSKKFKDLYLSGNTITLGNQTISSSASGISTSGNITSAGTIQATTITSTQPSNLSGTLTGDLVGSVYSDGSATMIDGVAGVILGDVSNASVTTTQLNAGVVETQLATVTANLTIGDPLNPDVTIGSSGVTADTIQGPIDAADFNITSGAAIRVNTSDNLYLSGEGYISIKSGPLPGGAPTDYSDLDLFGGPISLNGGLVISCDDVTFNNGSGTVDFGSTTVDFSSATVNGLTPGVDLTAFSVGAEASASGDGGIAYNNSTGVFTYTPPDLSGYQTTLVSGTDIKTINGTSLLGSGDVTISASGADLSAVNQNYTPDTDNAYDLGIAAGNFLRTGYFKTSVVIGTGQYSNATLTYNADGELQSSQTINTYGLTSSSYMTISAGFGGLIFWQERGGNIGGLSGMNGNDEMVWYGSNYSTNGPTYQLDNDQANLQIGGEVTKTISGVTLGATTSLNFSDPYYFNPGSTVTITGVVGTTELNNQTYYIDGSNNLYSDPSLSTPINSSAFTPYVSGGTAVIAPRATASLPVLHSAPSAPKSGMMAVADGTNWNPTSTGTETMVVYLGGAWRTIANA